MERLWWLGRGLATLSVNLAREWWVRRWLIRRGGWSGSLRPGTSGDLRCLKETELLWWLGRGLALGWRPSGGMAGARVSGGDGSWLDYPTSKLGKCPGVRARLGSKQYWVYALSRFVKKKLKDILIDYILIYNIINSNNTVFASCRWHTMSHSTTQAPAEHRNISTTNLLRHLNTDTLSSCFNDI